MAYNMPVQSNPVQDLGQKQLKDLDKELKHVQQQRKCITKKRQEAQNKMIELERQLVIYNAKCDNSLAMKEKSRVEMQKLRGAIMSRCRTTSDLDHQLTRLRQVVGSVDEQSDGLSRKAGGDEEELNRKITEVKKELLAIVQYQTSSSDMFTQFTEELESETQKKLALEVALELQKNNQDYGQQTMDDELQEKMRLEQKLQQLKTKEQDLEEEKQHLQQLTERQHTNLSELINNNIQLTKAGQRLAEEYDSQKNTTNKIIREIQCAKHDEASLQETATEVDVRVSSLKTQLDQQVVKRNCLLRKIKEKETVQADNTFASSCQSSMSNINMSSTSVSTTCLDSSGNHTEPTTSSFNLSSPAGELNYGSPVGNVDSANESNFDEDHSRVPCGSSELVSSDNTGNAENCM